MSAIASGQAGHLNLQATLSAASQSSEPYVGKHHPITCPAELYFDGAGLACEHGEVADDVRTQHCVNHSVALLLIELASRVL